MAPRVPPIAHAAPERDGAASPPHDVLQMRPRHVHADAASASYVDRAALRRTGGAATTASDTFDARWQAAGRTKGLDLELLAQERARIAQEAAKQPAPPPEDPAQGDDELDAALEEGRRAQERAREITERIAAARAKFRRVGEEPDVIYVDGKKMRRKRQAPAPAAASKSPRTVPPPAFAVRVDDADDDIFGEADVWDGLSDDDAPRPKAQPAPGDATPAERPREWVPDAHQTAPPEAPLPEAPLPEAPPDEPPSDEPERLEGLSTSALPSEWSRWMLERPDAPRTERTEPRSRRRRRGRGASASP
ncbi:hypothetical protein MCAP1_002494 [Malassezia caprae]|uniref:Uncharacterized protein n=1 Tax=Malassezia caprae TaxID=1381934 RepID=A0AAF0E7H4_9BASI|nr:hypothetical protein MCAP1_002494 [Malassezia caprae]